MIFLSIYCCDCWRAIPANQATYSLRQSITINEEGKMTTPDDILPRDQLSFMYKFGWCRPDVISQQFLRRAVNITLPTYEDTQGNFIYLISHYRTRRYLMQCVVMKAYVNRKYLFLKSRLPLYYCQGEVIYLMFNTVNKYAIHEFYLYQKLAIPANFVFEFYHAPAEGF